MGEQIAVDAQQLALLAMAQPAAAQQPLDAGLQIAGLGQQQDGGAMRVRLGERDDGAVDAADRLVAGAGRGQPLGQASRAFGRRFRSGPVA